MFFENRSSTVHADRSGKYTLLKVLLLCFLVTGFQAGWSLAENVPGEILGVNAEQDYQTAKNYYTSLLRNNEISGERANWLKGVRMFRKIYITYPKNQLAPASLYMMGTMHHCMFQRFSLPMDQDEAINYFSEVARLFPANSLADDALFNTAELYLQRKKDPEKAAKLFRQIADQFPGGDKAGPALAKLKELEEQTPGIAGPPDESGFSDKLVNVLPVKYWSSDDYTRIVIRSSAPVKYTPSLLEKNDDLPRRLYIDFAGSYIPPKFRAPVPIRDGLLKQVRTGQFDPTTVRVVLDIESISDYKIFNLNDPFRVVVDVHGQKKGEKAAPASGPVIAAGTETQSESRPPVISVTHPKLAPDLVSQTAPENGKKETPPLVISENKEIEKTVVSLQDNKKHKPGTVATAVATASAEPDESQAQTPSFSLAQQLGLGVKRIVIDPGHGGKDPGAMAFGLKEKDIVLEVGKKVARELHERYGFEVIMTRDRDIFLPLEERTAIANTRKADLFVSIHVNAHPRKTVRGVETFYLNLATNAEAMRVAARENATSTHNISDLQDILTDLMKNSKIRESSRLAEYVNSNMVSGLEKLYKVKNLGVKQAPFYVLIGAEMPAVLAEISFITNPEESNLLRRSTYLDSIGSHIAEGVADYANNQTTAALQL